MRCGSARRIEGVEGPGGNLAATSAVVTRYRTALEASRGYRFQRGLSLQPSLEAGLRRDGGDAETGAGVDLGGGLIVSDALTGLSAGVRVRMLLVHQDQGFRDRGHVPIVWLQPGAVDAVRVHGEAGPVLGRTGRKRRPGSLGPGAVGVGTANGGRRQHFGQSGGGDYRLRATTVKVPFGQEDA